ncbi:MAG TPA: chemotaxis protein CheW [Roseiflexaceae bacterium]|nr:chemotaxis protein CheW [Roseiflexaceae bacterium]
MFASSSAEKDTAAPATIGVLLLRLGGELYGVPSASVREVVRYRAYTPVPGAPPSLPGILSQRGTILPVVELRPLLGLETVAPTRAARLVIVAHQEIEMALSVEAVLDLAELPADTLEPLPATLDPARARFLHGIARYEQQPVALLDLDELIAGLRAGA